MPRREVYQRPPPLDMATATLAERFVDRRGAADVVGSGIVVGRTTPQWTTGDSPARQCESRQPPRRWTTDA